MGQEALSRSPRLLEQMRGLLRTGHYAIRTEEAYFGWAERYLRYHRGLAGRWVHPRELGAAGIERFLTHLAVEQHVAASTQNVALAAVLFLYRNVLKIELPSVDAVRARRGKRLPVVLSVDEVRRLVAAVEVEEPQFRLMVTLLYGTGMRLLECLRLRVKDVDFERMQLAVRAGKGDKDRAVPLPVRAVAGLREQLEQVRTVHSADLAAGRGPVWLPYALAEKYPNSGCELGWQWLFPSRRLSEDPRTPGVRRRHHVHENMLQKVVRRAVLSSGLTKKASCHTLRHSFATHPAGSRL